MSKRRHREGGHQQQVHRAEGVLERAPDEGADALGALVVLLLETGAQHVGTHQDAQLDLGAEAGAARRDRHFLGIRGAVRGAVGAARAVAHAVVARQVGARLGGGDHVVGGHHVFQRAELHGNAADARLPQPLAGRVQRAAHGRIQPLQDAVRDTHHELFGRRRRRRVLHRRLIQLIDPTHGLERHPRGGHVGGGHADHVQGGGIRHQPEPGHRAVGGLEAVDAAERRRLPYRAAGIGAQRERHQTGGHHRRRAAAGAAGHYRIVPGIAHRAEAGVFAR